MLMLISGQVVGFGRSVAESTLTPSISDFMMLIWLGMLCVENRKEKAPTK
ncbi:hypothetical protein HanIR_Chr09g0407461 [Helianthus annuus]|nr:hypothetical protein HanIR_Chr09g0407461 [Helianthus annuus]